MKILVTGASGYLGTGIVNSLELLGQNVISTDVFQNQLNSKGFIQSDIFTIEDPYSYFNQPDVLLHLAWRDGFKHNEMSHLEDIGKHYSFIKKLSDSGIKKIAIMGTMHEIGFHEGSIDEDTPCHPMTLYGIAKDALRKSVLELLKKNKSHLQWLRGFYIVGTNPRGNSIFSKISQAHLENKTSFPFTSGENQYDFLDYEDFCNYVALAVSQDTIDGIINICSGKPVKLKDRVESFIKENNFNITLNYGAFPDREYDSLAVWGNPTKIKEILSFLKNKE